MAIDIELTVSARKTSAQALRMFLGETCTLYNKTQVHHWNVTGPRFNALHNMFMTQ